MGGLAGLQRNNIKTPTVLSVHLSAAHDFSKLAQPQIVLLQGRGVDGDAHCGATVQHRSRVAQDPAQPNLRQVHLIQSELFDALAARGFTVAPGALGENITTRGIDLLALPQATVLQVGEDAEIVITGLRNPCAQIERFQAGLLSAVLDRAPDGGLIRKAGVMGIVRRGGVVRAGDSVRVQLPPLPHRALDRI